MRQPVRCLLAALLSLLLSATFLVSSAAASTGYTAGTFAARLVELLNATRQQHGLVPLKLATGTTTVAAGWTQQLASDGHLSHNPNLQAQLESHGSSNWTVLGENVGDSDAQDPDGLWNAYMASPEHRDNVLTAKFRYLGNAVVFAGGRAWNTMDFVDAYASAQPTAKPAPKASVRVATAPTAKPVRPTVVRAPRPAQAAKAVQPRGTRSAVRVLPRSVTKPAVEAAKATAVLQPAPAAVSTPSRLPMDRSRVLTLAVAAMLALLLGGLWLGVAIPTRR